jgi:O-antigen/teichoic acid export membrane protein
LKKKYFYNLSLSIVNILFPIFSFPYASHILGPIGIGKVQFIISFAQYFALLAALGIPIYGIKEIASHRDNPRNLAKTFTELTSIYFITSIIFFLLYVAIILIHPFFSTDKLLFFGSGMLILLSFSYTDWFYMGIEEFKAIAIRSVFIKIISLILLYTLVKSKNDFAIYLLITIFSILGNQILSFILVFKKTSFHFSELNFSRHIRPILYIYSASIAASMYTVLDTVLLGFLSNDKAVGLYTAAIKLVKITLPFVTSMGVILIPSISNNLANNKVEDAKSLIQKSFIFLILLSIPVTVGLAQLAPEFIYIFSGNQFLSGTTSMRILSLLPILIGLGHLFSFQILIPLGKNKEIFYPMLAGLVSCLLLNFLLVPSLQEKGAAIATVITETIVTISYFYFIRKSFSVQFNVKLILQSLFGASLFVPTILLIRRVCTLPIQTMIISIIICACLYLMIHIFLFKNRFIINFLTTFKSGLRETNTEAS